MSASGTVTIRFDVQGNEKLLQSLTTLATGASQATTGVTKLQSTLGGIGVGNLGPLNNIATSVRNMGAGMTAAETKVTSFKTKLAGIGTQLSSNATSFGVATASIWGVYNAYDSLEKVQIRAHAAAVKVETLETSLAALTERRRIAVEKGNLTGEQLRVLNEKIADTTDKLSVAQERNADVTQDVQEAWAGFFSTVGPQAIAATGSIIQLANTFKGSFANSGGVFNTIKNAIIGLIPSLKAAKTESLLLSPALGGITTSGTSLKTVATGLASGISPLAAGFKGLASSALSLKAPLGGIATAAPAAATGIISMGSGLTGLDGKLKGAGTSAVGLKGSLLGLGITVGVIGLVTAGALELAGAMNKLALETSHIKTPVSVLEATMDKTGKSMQTFQQTVAETEAEARAGVTPLIFALDAVFGTHMRENILKSAGALDAHGKIIVDWDKKIQAAIPTVDKMATSTDAWVNMLIKADTPAKMEAFNKAFAASGQSVERYQQIVTEADKIQKAYNLTLAQSAEVNKKAMSSWELQTHAFEGSVKSINLASKAYLDVHNTIVAVNPKITENITKTKEQTAAQKAMASAVENSTKFVHEQDFIYSHFGDTLDNLVKKFGALSTAGKKPIAFPSPAELETQNVPGPFGGNPKAVTRKFDTAALKEHIAAIEEEEEAIVKVGKAYGLTNIDFEKFIKNGKDDTAAMNDLVTAAIDYTAALTNQDKNQKLVAEGVRTGTQQAEDFFNTLVEGTAKEITFQSSVAQGAETLGIHADMLAFSSGKMQELIKNTQAQTLVFDDMKNAAVQSTAWLGDSVIQQTLLNTGMQKGAESANDWTASMIESVAAEKTNHDQLVKLAEQMTGLNNLSSLTSEQLQGLMTGFKQTGDAVGSLAAQMRDQLIPIFEPLKSFLTATNWKDFSSAFKDLDLKKLGIPKDLRDSLKDAGKDLLHVNENALEARTGLSALFTVAFTGRSKGIKSGIKELLSDLSQIPTLGDLTPFTNQLKAIMDLPKEERAAAFKKMGPAVAELMKALSPDAMGFVLIDPEEVNKINTALGETGPSAQGSVSGINNYADSVSGLAKSMLEVAEANFDPSKFTQQPDTPKGNKVFKSTDPSLFNKGDTTIKPPAPLVFPPPDMHNITDAIKKIEVDIGSMVDFAANLVLILPPMNIDAVNEGLTTAEENLGSIIDFTAGLVAAFPKPNIEQINAGLVEAENNLGSIIDFVAALKTVFPKPDTKLVLMAATQANAQIKSVATFISSSAMKLTFQKPDIRGVIASCDASVKRMLSLEGVASGLKLKFPKPDISEIDKGVKEAQAKINSLKGTTVTNHVKTVFDNAGGNILNDVKIMSAAAGKLFTTNGEQLFRVGDNPGGRETIAMIPHDKPHEIMDRLMKMFPPITSTLRERTRRPAMQTISGGISAGGGQRSGPTVVNVTTEVYLFPGSAQFKKYIKSIMLEGLSGLPIV